MGIMSQIRHACSLDNDLKGNNSLTDRVVVVGVEHHEVYAKKRDGGSAYSSG
jgi:hypothetical protein